MDKQVKPIACGFEREWIDVPLDVLHASKSLPPTMKLSVKYLQIRSSIEAVGLVEPLVVIQHSTVPGHFAILDGHLRAEALRDLGTKRAKCLISKDDESYTYNKCVNRLAVVQEHKMIVRAYESGVSADRLAAALGISVGVIRARFRMLDGVCDEAIKLLSDKPVPRRVFPLLRQMQPFRQIDVAQAMINLGNYSSKLVLAMLETTSPDQLVDGFKQKVDKGGTTAAIQRLERELAALQADTRLLEDSYGPDNLKLVVIKRYVASLLNNARVVRWMAQFHADYLQQLQLISEIKTLATDAEKPVAG
jgi:hypothetical protein